MRARPDPVCGAVVIVAVCIAAAAVLSYAAEDLVSKGKTAADLNKGQSDKFKFSSEFLSEKEKADMRGIRQNRSRKVEDLNRGSADNFKMKIQPRVETSDPQAIGIDREKSLGTKGNVKTTDQMSELNKR